MVLSSIYDSHLDDIIREINECQKTYLDIPVQQESCIHKQHMTSNSEKDINLHVSRLQGLTI